MTTAALIFTAIAAGAALWTVRLAYRAIRLAKDSASASKDSAASAAASAEAATRTAEAVAKARLHDRLTYKSDRLRQIAIEIELLQRFALASMGGQDPQWIHSTKSAPIARNRARGGSIGDGRRNHRDASGRSGEPRRGP